MKRTVLALLTVLLLAATAGVAMAQEAPIDITSSALVEVEVVNAKGEKELVRQPAVKVLPGEEVIFVNTYANRGQAPAEAVVINNAVPEHMIYVGASATGENATVVYSVDGKTFGPLSELTVTEADGSKRPAASADVTHIRWTRSAPLAPQEEARVEFRARLK